MKSCEQEARDMLERMGVEDAQSMTSGDVVELANLICDARHTFLLSQKTLKEVQEIKESLVNMKLKTVELQRKNAMSMAIILRATENDLLPHFVDIIAWYGTGETGAFPGLGIA